MSHLHFSMMTWIAGLFIMVFAMVVLWPDEPAPTITVPTHLGVIYYEDTHNAYMQASIRPGGAFIPWRCEDMVAEFGPPVYASPSAIKADLQVEARGQGSQDLRVSLCLANVVVEVFE